MKKDMDFADDAEEEVVVITDEDGTAYYYREEMRLEADGKLFGILSELADSEAEWHGAGCDCGCEEDAVIITKIVTEADGEEVYVEPTDEEFDLAQEAYESLFEED